MNAKKIGIGFAALLFFVAAAIIAAVPVFAEDYGMSSSDYEGLSVQSTSMLYEGGVVRGMLTKRMTSPWRVAQYYVGNNPAVIVRVLKEQGVSLSPHTKFPAGMIISIPQKYVRKELLPTPSVAEVVIKEAEHQAELQKQANVFFASLRVKDRSLQVSWGFFVLLVFLFFAAMMARASWKKKFVEMSVEAHQRSDVIEELEKQKRDLERNYAMLASFQVGRTVSFKDQNGLSHACLIKRHELDLKHNAPLIWLQCVYCDAELSDHKEKVLGHIAKAHPEKMLSPTKVRK